MKDVPSHINSKHPRIHFSRGCTSGLHLFHHISCPHPAHRTLPSRTDDYLNAHNVVTAAEKLTSAIGSSIRGLAEVAYAACAWPPPMTCGDPVWAGARLKHATPCRPPCPLGLDHGRCAARFSSLRAVWNSEEPPVRRMECRLVSL